MRRQIKLWYGSLGAELLAALLPGLPFGLGVGHSTGRYIASLVTSLSISVTVYILFKLDLMFIHPLFQKLPPNQQVTREVIAGLLENLVGAWLAFSICNRIFGSPFQGKLAWLLAGGTVATVMIVHAVTYTFYSHAELKRRIAQEQQLRTLATQAELRALKAQINPHFLFNTLNTIAALIHTEPTQAEATVERLADMFRYILAGSDRGMVSLEKELAFVDGYLEIERVRFGERLHVAREIGREALDVPVPSLILQPLVENAVQHGRGDDGSVELTLRAWLDGDEVIIAVADRGPGMVSSHGLESRPGHGLRNVDERLRKTYGEAYALHIAHNEPQGAVVTIRIPVEGEKRGSTANANR